MHANDVTLLILACASMTSLSSANEVYSFRCRYRTISNLLADRS